MKKRRFSSFAVLLIALVFMAANPADKNTKRAYKALKKQFPEFVYIPNGTWAIANDNDLFQQNKFVDNNPKLNTTHAFWMSKYEVSNAKWKVFVADIRESVKGDSFKMLLPDTNRWAIDSNGYIEPMRRYYYRHPAYNNYPVVNVSIAQCQAYCNWLAEKMQRTEMAHFKNIEVRLPTDVEWEYAARGGNDAGNYPFGEYLRNSKGEYLANFRKIPEGSVIKFKGNLKLKISYNNYEPSFLTAPVNMYFENGYGLFHMAGNVAEFVLPPNNSADLETILEKNGITRGGSFFDPAHYMKCSVRDFYPKDSSAHFTRGFRPVLTFSQKS